MSKYRKKPVTVEAHQFPGAINDVCHWGICPQWIVDATKKSPESVGSIVVDGQKATIMTLEGPITATAGDFIIQGIKGELYPCKPDIFAATYTKDGYEELAPHQQRVVDEKTELDEKLSKLRAFMPDDESNKIFMGLPRDEKVRLICQESAMSVYSSVLGERIAAFQP